MLAEAVNRLTRKNKFHLQLVSFTAKNRETKKKWFNKHSLDIFLNSLFNTSSALAEHLSDHLDKYIGYSEVGSNQRIWSTGFGSNQRICQGWSSSMEYSSFVFLMSVFGFGFPPKAPHPTRL